MTSSQDEESVKYYTDDYDYPTYYQTFPESKPTHQHVVDLSTTSKRFKNNLPTVSFVNEKCPIYVHRCEKYPTYDLASPKLYDTGAKEIANPKSVLDKLEETYWATWKPKKEAVKPIKNSKLKNREYGDHEEEVIKYFSAKNFELSSASVVEKSIKKSSKCLEQRKIRKERKQKEVDSQEIQTDLPTILPLQVENLKESSVPGNIESCEAEEEEIVKREEEIKTIKHTDSFILTKRKQENSEDKTHFQQPRSIRLFKKPGTASSSYIKGGSYPLKSCLKKQQSPRGNFRLGTPGSSLFVTTSSFNKKNKR